jgi:transposase
MVPVAHQLDNSAVNGLGKNLRCRLAACERARPELQAEDLGAVVQWAGGRRENVGTRVHARAVGEAASSQDGAVLEAGSELLINDPHRFDGVRVIDVDEHVWSHPGRVSKYVSVVIDLTPIRDGTGNSRLLDMVPRHSKKVFKAWLHHQEQGFRDGIEAIAMAGFTDLKTAAAEEIPRAVAVMDPLHVVALAGDAWD